MADLYNKLVLDIEPEVVSGDPPMMDEDVLKSTREARRYVFACGNFDRCLEGARVTRTLVNVEWRRWNPSEAEVHQRDYAGLKFDVILAPFDETPEVQALLRPGGVFIKKSQP